MSTPYMIVVTHMINIYIVITIDYYSNYYFNYLLIIIIIISITILMFYYMRLTAIALMRFRVSVTEHGTDNPKLVTEHETDGCNRRQTSI